MSNSQYSRRLTVRSLYPYLNNSPYYEHGKEELKQEGADFKLIGKFIQLLAKES